MRPRSPEVGSHDADTTSLLGFAVFGDLTGTALGYVARVGYLCIVIYRSTEVYALYVGFGVRQTDVGYREQWLSSTCISRLPRDTLQG